MGLRGLHDALEKPLAAVRYQFDDPKLVEEILRGLEGVKSPLPILQFLATKLWESRDEKQRRLTTEAYHALGGVAGALSMHADAMLAAMSPVEQKITRAIFLRLVTPERQRDYLQAVVRLAQRNRRRSQMILAAAREQQSKDPTKALALLREIEPGPVPRGWVELVLQTRYAGIAERVKYHHSAVWDAKLSPNGQRIAVALTDRSVEIWNADGSGEPIVLRGHEHSVDSLAWSHDGLRIASGSRDKTIRIWKTDGSMEHVVIGPDAEIHGYSAAWSPDGQHIAIGMKDGGVHVWDALGKSQ